MSPAPQGRSLNAMLADSEIDALFSARAPACYGKPGVAVASAAMTVLDDAKPSVDYYRLVPEWITGMGLMTTGGR